MPKSPLPKTFINKQKKHLLELRESIIAAVEDVTQNTLKDTQSREAFSGGEHTIDAGSDAYDRDFALNILSKEQDALTQIDAALSRIELGTYGICEMSGNLINQERLTALPFARFTVDCQKQWEENNS